jgi:hypothetical protein
MQPQPNGGYTVPALSVLDREEGHMPAVFKWVTVFIIVGLTALVLLSAPEDPAHTGSVSVTEELQAVVLYHEDDYLQFVGPFPAGEAREVGRVLAAIAREMRHSGEPVEPPGCLIAGGETTVTVRGAGKGGRNQELALSAALSFAGETGVLLASTGTDGIDGPTDAAGAFADGRTIQRARERGLDAGVALARNDSYPFFQALGDLIVTGPTGTNVMDLQLVFVRGG